MVVRLFYCGVLSVFLALGLVNPALSQDPPPSVTPQDQYLTGTVTALSDTSITVTRTALGKVSAVRTFSITAETHIEGKPKLKSRVTVRFVSGDDGDRAVRIIVRVPPQPKKQ
jgi:hypothetical protein